MNRRRTHATSLASLRDATAFFPPRPAVALRLPPANFCDPFGMKTLVATLLIFVACCGYSAERLLRPILASSSAEPADLASDAWDRVEQQLSDWEQHPEALEDEGLEPPRAETIPLLREVCHSLRDLHVDPPLRLVPNCEAGAVFECRSTPFLWSVEVERDGTLELSVFHAGKVTSTIRIA